ncbi:hypothetical protein GWI33_003145 [Rhynchophorus ferrugineus]|uniref:Uncharacterized protein n=1 Tax=Rhynchophorus ferrugineus TaxID=354439 RepID=A0A834HJG8_RHYFE|nr:hypothetical protein GWI33_003145 [Rhynchophorus ferrugineus]
MNRSAGQTEVHCPDATRTDVEHNKGHGDTQLLFDVVVDDGMAIVLHGNLPGSIDRLKRRPISDRFAEAETTEFPIPRPGGGGGARRRDTTNYRVVFSRRIDEKYPRTLNFPRHRQTSLSFI